jgi:hypothetical protein
MDSRLTPVMHLRRVCDLLALVDEWLLLKAFAGLATMFLLHRWQNGM